MRDGWWSFSWNACRAWHRLFCQTRGHRLTGRIHLLRFREGSVEVEIGQINRGIIWLTGIVNTRSRKTDWNNLCRLKHTFQTNPDQFFSSMFFVLGKNMFFYRQNTDNELFLFCFFPHFCNLILQVMQEYLLFLKVFIWGECNRGFRR